MARQQSGRGPPDRPGDGRVQVGDLLVEDQPAATEAAQGQAQARGGHKLGAGAGQLPLLQPMQLAAELIVTVDQQGA